MLLWTIYSRPADYPTVPYVVRAWQITADGPVDAGVLGLADSIEQARGYLPEGATRLGRMDEDDPVIVESWA